MTQYSLKSATLACSSQYERFLLDHLVT